MRVEEHCKIVDKIPLNAHAVSMTLEAGEMVRRSFRGPGQFVHIKCGEGRLLRRPISVCACQEDEPHDLLRIVFEARGAGTRWLRERRVGDTLDVLGLLGNGFQMKPGGRYLLAGGGIGAPPLLGCALFAGGTAEAVLGFRDQEHVLLEEEFRQDCANVTVCTDDGSYGEQGYVDAALRAKLEQDAAFDAVLACGPRPMLRGVSRVAADFGLPCYVSLEERMGCGVGACLVCACDMADGTRLHVCKDGPVFDAREVDWDA